MPTGMELMQFAANDGPIVYYCLYIIYVIYVLNFSEAIAKYAITGEIPSRCIRSSVVLLAEQPISRVIPTILSRLGYGLRTSMAVAIPFVTVSGAGITYGDVGVALTSASLLLILCVDPAGFSRRVAEKRKHI
ncbi:hypothetical protein HDV00_003770 [Rhizophlyctis rosea]|nr:hypothetical protein HDV00_003770 [Rhizophlyctis rosea]